MTQDEFLEIAKEVYGETVWTEASLARLQQFVNLVAAKERRECAKLAAEVGYWGLVHEIEARGEQT